MCPVRNKVLTPPHCLCEALERGSGWGPGAVLEAGTCPAGAFCIKEDLPPGRRGWGGQEVLHQAVEDWSLWPSVWLLSQEAGEHG